VCSVLSLPAHVKIILASNRHPPPPPHTRPFTRSDKIVAWAKTCQLGFDSDLIRSYSSYEQLDLNQPLRDFLAFLKILNIFRIIP
jgi:hypothetical protein